MTKTISAFRVKRSLEEVKLSSQRFCALKRKGSFIPSFFLVSKTWNNELEQNKKVNVLAEVKLVEGKKAFVEVFDKSLNEGQLPISALEIRADHHLDAYHAAVSAC